MGGFLEQLQAEVAATPKCKVQRWLDSIKADYRNEILDACAGDYPSSSIWRVIVAREGLIFSQSVFARHRKGLCTCGI